MTEKNVDDLTVVSVNAVSRVLEKEIEVEPCDAAATWTGAEATLSPWDHLFLVTVPWDVAYDFAAEG